MTKVHIEPNYASVKPSGYYTYIHRRATDLTPFYVGKGKGNRAWEKNKSDCRSDHWLNCARKNGVVVEICQDGLDEDSAYLLEAWVMAILKRDGHVLVNQSEGGRGPYGQRHSDETRAKISEAMHYPVWNDLGEMFHNACEAARVMRERGWPKAASSGIFAAAKEGSRSDTCYGHAWSRTGVPAMVVKVGPDVIICVEEVMIFNSGTEAAKWLTSVLGRSIGPSWIVDAARKGKAAYGYTWMEIKE